MQNEVKECLKSLRKKKKAHITSVLVGIYNNRKQKKRHHEKYSVLHSHDKKKNN